MSKDLDDLHDLASKIRDGEPGLYSVETVACIALDVAFGLVNHLRTSPADGKAERGEGVGDDGSDEAAKPDALGEGRKA